MKFLHLGDLHLGKSLGDFDLIEDQKYILDQIMDIAKNESVDAMLIAGDVYDKAIPSEAATRLLDSFLSRLAKEGITVFMISGNHDSDDRLNYGSRLFESNRVFVSAKYQGELYKKTVGDGEDAVDVYLLPFVKASQVRHFHPDAKIETYDDAVRTVLEHAKIDRNRPNILVAHQFVTGSSDDPVLGGSEGVGTQSVGLVEKIGYDCFDDFSYVALGHIHSPQQVGRKEVRYSGSPLKYSLSEVQNEKSVPLITFDKGNVDVQLIPLKPMRDMRHLKGKLRELLDTSKISAPEDFIYATLTDEELVTNAMGIFQQYYPNTVRIDYDNSHTREVEQVDISMITKDRNYDDLIGDFYRQIYGCEISGEEMDIMRAVAREAGVLHETD